MDLTEKEIASIILNYNELIKNDFVELVYSKEK